MLLRVENLGPLRKAEVDLSKRLIVLTGPNNTGKTYLAWSVYGLSQARVRPLEVPSLDEWAQNLVNSPSHELDLGDAPRAHLREYISAFTAAYREQLHLCFAAERDTFRDAKVEFQAEGDIPDLLSAVGEQGRLAVLPPLSPPSPTPIDGRCVLVRAVRGSSRLRFTILDGLTASRVLGQRASPERQPLPSEAELEAFTADWLAQASPRERAQAVRRVRQILESATSRAFHQRCTLFPAERIAVNIFAKELALKRSEFVDDLVDEALDEPEGLVAIARLTKRVGRYPWPIRDSLMVANDLAQLSKQESPFAGLAEELETAVLGGRIFTSEHGEMLFSPAASPERRLNLHLTASVVKSLSSLVFYFRHMAWPDEFVIIDEPELNLHPDNQRLIARILAKAVNWGFRVMISTHSDYVIRELNNLIMLSRVPEGERKGLGFEPEWALAPEKVGVYLFDGGTARPVPVEETGFSVSTIDEVTNKLNADTQRLYDRLFADRDDA